jgi:hypothetical protein
MKDPRIYLDWANKRGPFIPELYQHTAILAIEAAIKYETKLIYQEVLEKQREIEYLNKLLKANQIEFAQVDYDRKKIRKTLLKIIKRGAKQRKENSHGYSGDS